MAFDGMGYEDAIVISERVVKRRSAYLNIVIEEFKLTIVNTKLGAEEITRDIPNVREEVLANLDKKVLPLLDRL